MAAVEEKQSFRVTFVISDRASPVHFAVVAKWCSDYTPVCCPIGIDRDRKSTTPPALHPGERENRTGNLGNADLKPMNARRDSEPALGFAGLSRQKKSVLQNQKSMSGLNTQKKFSRLDATYTSYARKATVFCNRRRPRTLRLGSAIFVIAERCIGLGAAKLVWASNAESSHLRLLQPHGENQRGGEDECQR
jgi:hypothetical protein